MSTEYIYHYYEKTVGPFVSLSGLPLDNAQNILDALIAENKTFAAKRSNTYLARRRELEQMVRRIFMDKGGKPQRSTPHYFVIGECPWLETWFQNPAYIKIPMSTINPLTISFTYGDTFPTFSERIVNKPEYWGKVYLWEEIFELISRLGLPQDKWDSPVFAQPAYVEAQLWSDEPVKEYLKGVKLCNLGCRR